MARLRMTTTNRSAETTYVTGILIDPSGTDWVCVITDTAGNIVFSARSAVATAQFFPIKDTWAGVNITTATALTAVYIYS